MHLFFYGNTGFHSKEREREICSLFNKRLHSFASHSVLKHKDITECFCIKQENGYEFPIKKVDQLKWLYNKKWNIGEYMKTKNKQNKVNLFLDSGAYSAWSQNAVINIHEYIAFIKSNIEYIDVYANLDAIGDPDETLKNQRIMEKAGLSPLPCYHFGEPIKYLKKYLKGYKYVALGGMVPISTKDLRPWLDDIFLNHICDKDGIPRVKIHGFGMTSLSLMLRYPWYCMTEEDHEVLTKSGWKFKNDLEVGEDILCYSQGKAQWESILEIPVFPVKNIDLVAMDNRNFSARVTHNHNWVTTNQNNKKENWKFRTTNSMKIGDCIPRVGKYSFPVEKKYTNEQVELLAWFWTDGSIKKRSKYKKDSVMLYQSDSVNFGKVERIQRALDESHEAHCKGENWFELYGEIRDFLLEIAPNKKLPIHFIWDLTRDQLQRFIDCSVLADGSITKLIRKKGFAIAVSRKVKKHNLEIIRIACLLLEIPTSIYSTKKGLKGLNSSSVDWIYFKEVKQKEVKYTGNLWCVRVPSKAFFTRCNDKIYVTGNSVDSTSWVMTGRMGGILIPRRSNGQYDYHKNPLKITVSSKSPAAKKKEAHFKTFSPVQQKIFKKYYKAKGFKMGKSSFRNENPDTYVLKKNEKWNKKKESIVETIIKPGLCNDYKMRDELNIIYFLDLEKKMKPWPWPFILKSRMKGFFEK